MSDAGRPRGLVQVNGTDISGWLKWKTEVNSFFQADTFAITLAIQGLPSTNDAAWFASQQTLDVEIFGGVPADPDNFDKGDLTSMLKGRVDEASFRWTDGLLELTGRDRTADFIDNKTSEKYPNLTASEIVQKLAAAHGMTAVVTATKEKVGRFYKADNVRMQDDRTEWDLIVWLAREQDYVAYVKGDELHFEPKPSETSTPTVLTWTPPVTGGGAPTFTQETLDTRRTLTIAKGIHVEVRSWNAKQKKAFVRQAVRGGSKKPQKYVYTFPGLTPEQAQKKADSILAELSRHEMKMGYEGPGETTLTKASVIKLEGTNTAFDQVYFPNQIMREMSAAGGFVTSVQLKNHATESEANL